MKGSRSDLYILKFWIEGRLIPFLENNLECIKLVIDNLKRLLREEGFECLKEKSIDTLVKDMLGAWFHNGFKLKNESVEFRVIWTYPMFLVLVSTEGEPTKKYIEKLNIEYEKVATFKKKETGFTTSTKSKVSSLIKGVKINKRGRTYVLYPEEEIPENLIDFLIRLEVNEYCSQYNCQEALEKWNDSLDTVKGIYKIKHIVNISDPIEDNFTDIYQRFDKIETEFNNVKSFLEWRDSYQKSIRKSLLRLKDNFEEKVVGEKGVTDSILNEQENNMSINEYILIYVNKIDSMLDNVKDSLDNKQKANDLARENFHKRLSVYKNIILTLILVGIFFLCYLQF